MDTLACDIYPRNVPFEPRLVEAKLTLGMVSAEEMPMLAADALEAGRDGRFIRRMAALHCPSGWEVDQILPQFMVEAGLSKVAIGEAALRVARNRARHILREGCDPLAFSEEFEGLYVRADYAKEIRGIGTLHDETYVAKYMGRSEEELRDYARRLLIALVGTEKTDDSNLATG